MRFWLGTHEVSWLKRLDVELFVSHRRFQRQQSLPRARGPWALDSGAFSELSQFGEWRSGHADYVAAVRRYQEEVGQLAWCAPRDYMCEPFIVRKTGLSVEEHQRRTVDDFLRLRQDLGMLVVPVLQGWEPGEYLRCAERYERAGVALELEPLVGIGSVCRRGGSREAEATLVALSPLRLHGFGLKNSALLRLGYLMESADSMAWSYNARKHKPLPGCSHKSCANCALWAVRWRDGVLRNLAQPQQAALLSEVS